VTFLHVKHEFPTLLKEETEDGQRVYCTPDGKRYPSVTTVIAPHNKDAIDRWKARVGHSKDNKISETASNGGDMVHVALETLLNKYSTG
jgi:hypothetical protein